MSYLTPEQAAFSSQYLSGSPSGFAPSLLAVGVVSTFVSCPEQMFSAGRRGHGLGMARLP
jgi:hypothetical protein